MFFPMRCIISNLGIYLKVLLSCGGKDGSYLVAAIARRKLAMNNTIFCLRVPEVGVLMHPIHPDTTMFTGKTLKTLCIFLDRVIY